jgi:hypothetical protein
MLDVYGLMLNLSFIAYLTSPNSRLFGNLKVSCIKLRTKKLSPFSAARLFQRFWLFTTSLPQFKSEPTSGVNVRIAARPKRM